MYSNDDLPPWLRTLARSIARDCQAPGQYSITFTVSPYGRHPVETAVISRLETIRVTQPREAKRSRQATTEL